MLLNLIKLEFLGMLNAFSGGKNSKKKKTSSVGIIILMIFLGVYFGLASFAFSSSLTLAGSAFNMPYLGLLMSFFLTSVVSLIYTMFKSSSILFTFKDFDLLFSMPIKASTIIQSKIIFLYFSNFLFKLFLMLPSVLSWVLFSSPSILEVSLVVIAIPFINLIPMVIAAFFGFVVSYVSSFFRKSALFNVILSVLGIAVIFIISFSFSFTTNSSSPEELYNISLTLNNQLNSIYPLSSLFSLIASGDIIAFSLFIAISILAFIGFSMFVGKSFLSVRTRLTSQSVKRKAVEIKEESRGHFNSLMAKELKLLLSIPVYAMNILTGVIMGFLGVGALIYFYIAYPSEFLMIEEFKEYIMPAVPFILSFFVAYVSTTSCSISLEGKNLWMLKAMPIKASTIFLSKSLFNIYLQVPFAIIAGIVSAVILKADLIWTLIFILLPVTMCVFNTFISLLLNIRFPMLDWENPALPVKRGAPIFITVFLNMAIYMAGGFIAMIFNNMGAMFFISAFIIVNIINFAMYLFIVKNSEKMLMNL